MKITRRWIVRSLAAGAALLVLAVVTIQIILWTGIPRYLVLDKLQRRTGLRIQAATLATGWIGHTTLRNVQISLPLADKPFLEIPTLRVDHSNLISALLGDISIDSLWLDHPKISVIQDSSGRWNVEDVLQILAAASAPTGGTAAAAPEPAASGTTMPPALTIVSGTVTVNDRGHRSATLAPLAFSGDPRGVVVWECHAEIPGVFKADAELAPDSLWSHVVHMTVDHIGASIRPWIEHWPANDHLAGTWNGRLANQSLVGTFSIDDLMIGAVHATGGVSVTSESAGPVVAPTDLVFSIPGRAAPPVRVIGGSVLWTGTTARAREIWLATAGGSIRIDANCDPSRQIADLSSSWYGLEYPPGLTHSGTLSLNVEEPWPGHHHVKAALNSTAATSSGRWQADLNADGAGSAWNQMDWTLNAPTLEANWRRPVALHDVQAQLAVRGSRVDLSTVSLKDMAPGATFSIHATADLARSVGWAWADAMNFPIGPGRAPINFDFDAWVSNQQINLSRFYVRQGDFMIDTHGDYVYSRPSPVDLFLNASHILAPDAGATSAATRPTFLSARSLTSSAELTGTIHPLHLDIHGHLTGQALSVNARPLGDVAADAQGVLDSDDATIHSTAFTLFGGDWELGGWWPTDNHAFRIDIAAHNVALAEATARPDIRGSADAQASIAVTTATLAGITATGHAVLHNVALSSPTIPLRADEVDLPELTLAEGVIRANQIRLTQGIVMAPPLSTMRAQTGTSLPATRSSNEPAAMTASLNCDLHRPDQVDVTVNHAEGAWLVELPAAQAELGIGGLSTELTINAASRGVTGHLAADGYINAAGQGATSRPATTTASNWGSLSRLADFSVSADFGGRTLGVTRFHVQTLGGAVDGTASLDIDHFDKARVSAQATNFQSDAIAALLPGMRGLGGAFNANLQIAPSLLSIKPDAPPPLGPSRMSLDIQPAGASFRAIDLNAVHVVGFMTDDGFVLNNDPQSPNTLKLAGGDIQFWGRLVHHQDARLQGQIVVSFANLQLHEIQQSLSPKAKPESGELSGQFTLIVDPRNLAAASGQGDFRIDRSALVNLVFVNFLFDILHPGQILSPADGKGSVRLVLDNDRIHAITGRYFNNGFEVRADGTIDHVFQGPAAKLDILAVSSGRPLSKVPLPLLPDLDSILAVLQHDLLAEHIGGTIGQPSYKTIPLRDLTQEMLQFLTGDVRRQTESTAD